MSTLNYPDQPPEPIHKLLCEAIRNKRLIKFEYKDCRRIAEPHDYGLIEGVKKLLAYQIEGESQSGKLPDWRWAEVEKINRVQVLKRRFAGARAAPSGEHTLWDCRFASVSVPGEPPC
ncbi:MAG TPA: hypothetical protein VJ692_11870 [Nitrospiraceae bacterium]|nr:hypothetical protein [Nitrospiraceae bacterium]